MGDAGFTGPRCDPFGAQPLRVFVPASHRYGKERQVKIAFYVEDGLEQIVLTPDGKTEEAILDKLHDGSRKLQILKGSFYDCRGGWKRYTPHETNYGMFGASERGDESTMIVLRAASGMEAPSGGETENTGSTEGDSPTLEEGDAQHD